MRRYTRFFLIYAMSLLFGREVIPQSIPLPEHPRPDFMRQQWQNLNGVWQFEFDSLDAGIAGKWQNGQTSFRQSINVPFPWGSRLSGVGDEADIGWYMKEIKVNPEWQGKRIFLIIGAADWQTSAWLDGHALGTHEGGYVPFSFELTDFVTFGKPQKLIIRADDKRRDFTLYGKQGYGNARGIWQTVYLEARPQEYLDAVHFSPDIDHKQVKVTAYILTPAAVNLNLKISVKAEGAPIVAKTVIPQGKEKVTAIVPIPNPHLWSLDDPYLYEVEVSLEKDVVETYFGMRKISVVNLPGSEYPYVALNGQPVYLQLTLDQSYHPDGFYTFPSDAFMKAEIERSKSIGLNGIRPHIKVEIPRKLYWADKLGLLVMQDLPNSWGEPDARMRAESRKTLREMIKRDYNHPAIFSWILFNETWGLRTRVVDDGKEKQKYLPETQYWVASMYYLAKSLDPTRLVEDNSICCGAGHTETDINSFHDYLPGWAWEDKLQEITENSFPGSTFQFEKGYQQGGQPKINSECGNVWGYEGSTGDIDWSWDYHRMMNTFRKYPEMAGWLYTEHHDVINEWNGYWRFDRSEKFPGLEEIMPGMTLKDFHSPVYLSTGNEICRTVKGGEQVRVPLYLSSMTARDFGDELTVVYELHVTNGIGETSMPNKGVLNVVYRPYLQTALDTLTVTMPNTAGLAVLRLWLQVERDKVLHRNFMLFEIAGESRIPGVQVVSVAPNAFSGQSWRDREWDVLDGLKVNGAGSGYFEYTIPLPEDLDTGRVREAYFLAELSAKQLFVKDMDVRQDTDLDFMLGAKDDPSRNPNAYPMTDAKRFPSSIAVSVNGNVALTTILPDDPADHRGVLSWHHQLQDRKLREAGSYGYLIKVPVTKEVLNEGLKSGQLGVQIKTEGGGGVAVYGKSFGRYPLDPSLVLKY